MSGDRHVGIDRREYEQVAVGPIEVRHDIRLLTGDAGLGGRGPDELVGAAIAGQDVETTAAGDFFAPAIHCSRLRRSFSVPLGK